jgi:hypothetical protein
MERDNKPIIIMGVVTLLVIIIAVVLIIVKPFDKKEAEPTTEATTETEMELDVPESGTTEEIQSIVNTNISNDVTEGRCLNVFGAVIDLQSSQSWHNANTVNAGNNNGGVTVNEHGGVTHIDPNVPIEGETDGINDENGNGIDDNFETGGDGC